MSDTSSIFTGFLLMLAASAFPGPSDLLVVSAALESGLRGSLRVILGILLGDTVFILLATAGLYSVTGIFPHADNILESMSVLALIIMGVLMFRSASRKESPDLPMVRPGITQGFLITLADPTAIGFYAALLPLLQKDQPVQPFDGFRLFVCAATAILLVKCTYALLTLHLKERLLSPLLLQRMKHLTAGGILLMMGWMIFASL